MADGDAQVRTLDALKVHAQRGRDRSSYTVRSSDGATGLDLSLRETLQSITVITRQQIEDRRIQSLDDVLLGAPGITSASSDIGGRTKYRARGFAIGNYKVDGMDLAGGSDFSGAGQAFNMDLYESVQIVAGPMVCSAATATPRPPCT